MEKKCSICNEVKVYSEFQKDNRTTTGRFSACRRCCDKYRKPFTLEERQAKRRNEKLKHPEKVRARAKIYWALRRKNIVKAPCIICAEIKVEAHHCDYNKPLDVMWLCRKHHTAWHRVFEAEK